MDDSQVEFAGADAGGTSISMGRPGTKKFSCPGTYPFVLGGRSQATYVDQYLTYSENLPTYCGFSWTFGLPPTPCPCGHRKT